MHTKEINEVLDGVELLAVAAKKIAKDGVSLADLPEAIELIKHIDVIVAAVNGAKEIPAELKDLSQEELLALGMRVFSLVKAVKSA